jgi:putative endonuclease
VARNYKPQRWEIDLIARKEALLVFVEVKSRADTAFGYPEAAVNPQKQAHIRAVAEQYMLAHHYLGEIRFDIISIVTGPEPELVHFEDAF